MSNYNTIEPTVIDEELLRKAVNEQVSPEISEIARREGIEFFEVHSLRLDYKNILKIDNLWGFENVTKLQLDNNIIERIENINFLKNLEWLDLSFNNISVIEGLDGLTKLKDLTLFNNRISKLEGLDDLVNLNVLSIGNNTLLSLDQLSYLMKFENLRVLNANGNAICKNPNYRHFVLAHLKHLKYFDYRLVDEESVTIARKKYLDELIALEEEEKVAKAKKEEACKQDEQDLLYGGVHLVKIDWLFPKMFEHDPDFQKILQIASDLIQVQVGDYSAKFLPAVEELKRFTLNRHAELAEEKANFETCKRETKDAHDKECKSYLDNFYHFKKMQLRLLPDAHNKEIDVDECIKKLKDETQTLSNILMQHEMQIVEQFEDINKEFERSYIELTHGINEIGASTFTRLREYENEFNEKLNEVIINSFDRFNKGDMDEISDELHDLMSDKDLLVNAVTASHDFRLARIDHQEDLLITGLAKATETLINSIHEQEVKRNRTRVCEIISFVEKTLSEIEQAEENIY